MLGASYFLFNQSALYSQVGLQFDPAIFPQSQFSTDFKSGFKSPSIITKNSHPPTLHQFFQPGPDFSNKAYCFDELTFFCKMEVQMEKSVKFPVKFRLGDVQYVDPPGRKVLDKIK